VVEDEEMENAVIEVLTLQHAKNDFDLQQSQSLSKNIHRF